MNRFQWHVALYLATLLAALPSARAQKVPHVGYIYPAGGQQGSDFEATIGGQYLKGTAEVYVSGGGVLIQVSVPLDVGEEGVLSFEDLPEQPELRVVVRNARVEEELFGLAYLGDPGIAAAA